MRLWRIVFAYIVIVIIWQITQQLVFASSSWTQDNWLGGSGQSAWSDSTKYSSISNLATSVANKITISSNSNWYDPSWKYRQSLSVTNSGGSNLTDYQIPITLNTSSLISSSKLSANCTDLFVTDSTGSALPFWVVTSPLANTCGSSGQSATKIWVKASSVPTVGSTLYVYYGNSSASSQSNGSNVFPVFADFTSGSSLPTGWSQTYFHMSGTDSSADAPVSDSSTGSINVGSGVLTVTNNFGKDFWRSDYGVTHVYNDNTLSGSFIAESIINSQTNSSEWAKSGIVVQNALNYGGNNGQAFIGTTPRYGMTFQYQSLSGEWCNGATCPSSIIAVNVDSHSGNNTSDTTYPKHLRLIKNDSNQISGYYSSNGTDWTQQGSTVSPWGVSNAQYLSLFATSHNNTATSSATYPYIYARKYTATSPSSGSPANEEKTYLSSGSLTSSIYDTGQSSTFGTVTYSANTPANTSVSVKVRTSNNADMSGAVDFGSCNSVSSGSDISSNNCVTDGNRYLQYQVLLTSTDNLSSPTFQNISVSYDPVTTPSSTSFQASVSNSETNTISVPSCQNSKPSGAPGLFQIDIAKNSAKIFFSPVNDISKYFISYSTSPNAESYGLEVNLGSNGVQQYIINDLSPNSTYYFKVRGQNGCMPGDWSNIKSASTNEPILSKIISFPENNLAAKILPEKKLTVISEKLTNGKSAVCEYTVKSNDTLWSIAQNKLGNGQMFSDIKALNSLLINDLSPGEVLKLPCDEKKDTLVKAKEQVSQKGVKLDILVKDINSQPLEGAVVTLHSKIQTARTNKKGIARFVNVEPGEHMALLSYREYNGKQKLNVDGENKEQILTLQVQLNSGFSSYVVLGVLGTMGFIIVLLFFALSFVLKNKKPS